MTDDNDIMDQDTFQRFQQACCNGQFAMFLKTVKGIPLDNLQGPVLRNMWLFYSSLLAIFFEDKKVSATKLASFAKNANALGDVFLVLPLTDHVFWSLRALNGFYQGCRRSGIEADSALFDKMMDKALLTPPEQMKEVTLSYIFSCILPLIKFGQTSNNEKLGRVVRHYAQGIPEEEIMHFQKNVIVDLLPYVSFDITVEKWANFPPDVRQCVEEHANIQQAQRLQNVLPETRCGLPRKI